MRGRGWIRALAPALLLAPSALALAGCAAPDVVVIDRSGWPVAGALVYGQLHSFEVTATTNAEGEAWLELWPPQLAYGVQRAGYEPVFVPLDERAREELERPLTIVLTKRP
ncbi:MAG TPA: hypothetical protein DEA08_32635 [Planctomycetes bacterium]|nr:hypothetical protein [Planctomycetota bacterium]